jgi:hypothetical protein
MAVFVLKTDAGSILFGSSVAGAVADLLVKSVATWVVRAEALTIDFDASLISLTAKPVPPLGKHESVPGVKEAL